MAIHINCVRNILCMSETAKRFFGLKFWDYVWRVNLIDAKSTYTCNKSVKQIQHRIIIEITSYNLSANRVHRGLQHYFRRAARVKITVYGTPIRLNWKIMHIREFYYKNATLLYYANCLNMRKYYLDENLKHKSICLSRCSVKVTLYSQSGWVAWIYSN
jgi:hypothetical protein